MKVTDASSGLGKWYYYEKNLQGDIVGIMNADGYKVVSYSYDAWGVPYAPVYSTDSVVSAADKANAELNPFRYRGYYYDSETGYYYLQTRYYNPEWGRFINADSALYSNMLGFNMFVYCYNNPVNCIDPTGENGFSEALAGWASSAWGLTLVDGPLPIGDIVYWGGCAILGIFAVAETIALSDTISNTIQDEADVDSDIEDETYEHSLPTEGEPNSERELRDKNGVKQKDIMDQMEKLTMTLITDIQTLKILMNFHIGTIGIGIKNHQDLLQSKCIEDDIMNILELKKCMFQGREIEFSLNKHKYFLQPNFEDTNNMYIIYDCTNSNCITEVFAGSVEEITNYLFDGKYSLNNNLSKFIFSYIL